MRQAMVVLFLTAIVLVSCSSQSEVVTFDNDTYGFTITYPADWKVNEAAKIIPPPPATTSLQTEGLTIAITAWEHPSSDSEQASLKRDGWSEAQVSVDGVRATSYTRPPSDTREGMRKKVYVKHNGIEYDLTLLVWDNQQYETGMRVFDLVVKRFKWHK